MPILTKSAINPTIDLISKSALPDHQKLEELQQLCRDNYFQFDSNNIKKMLNTLTKIIAYEDAIYFK